ncbi:hypothetical protein BC829DRAFT_399216 [Chytridium lagenaria]|nr:hypothetical protein BC829DRAFT_399216 [Chytridium lagenaria]
MAAGYATMQLSVPSEEEMRRRLSDNGFSTSDMDQQKKKIQELLDHIKYNAESDHPAWQVVKKPKE